jgi:SHS2 domain-containing protein
MADAGIIAYEKDLNEAFSNAAKGMFSLISSLDDIKKNSKISTIGCNQRITEK